jgi:hypothetical protein
MEYSEITTSQDIDNKKTKNVFKLLYPSYSSYMENINMFDSNNYIEYIGNSTIYNTFFNFMETYKNIENEDFKKPIFSQTSKFKKNSSNYNNYKYLKINRDKDDKKYEKQEKEEKNIFAFNGPVNEKDKISVLFKSYLNKITKDTYKKISSDLINELLIIKNAELFEILSAEIINKCLFDTKYRNLYINLCNKIWLNQQLHTNLVEIKCIDNKYYWANNPEPFLSEIQVKSNIFQKLNFKKFFINYLHKLYISKDLTFDNLSDDEFFLKKKKIILLVELIGILYIEKYINFDIINLILINLLHLDNISVGQKNKEIKEIKDIEFECVYVLLKLLKENKSFNNGILYKEYSKIFNEYAFEINKIMENNKIDPNLSKRSEFFLDYILSVICDKPIKKDTSSNSLSSSNSQLQTNQLNSQSNYVNVINNNNITVDQIKNENSKQIISNYKNANEDGKTVIINKLCDFYFDSKSNKSNFFVKLFREMNDSQLIYNCIYKIIDNIEDIILDIPDVDKKIILLIKNIELTESMQEHIINKIKDKNLESDSDEDSDNDDDN